ncbi:hypothetical protein EDB19DRAFT_1704843 [Suillus lakei]|nr:hypothetical protein EDB19DRAFT_1704843 [Suillus lakei]
MHYDLVSAWLYLCFILTCRSWSKPGNSARRSNSRSDLGCNEGRSPLELDFDVFQVHAVSKSHPHRPKFPPHRPRYLTSDPLHRAHAIV